MFRTCCSTLSHLQPLLVSTDSKCCFSHSSSCLSNNLSPSSLSASSPKSVRYNAHSVVSTDHPTRYPQSSPNVLSGLGKPGPGLDLPVVPPTIATNHRLATAIPMTPRTSKNTFSAARITLQFISVTDHCSQDRLRLRNVPHAWAEVLIRRQLPLHGSTAERIGSQLTLANTHPTSNPENLNYRFRHRNVPRVWAEVLIRQQLPLHGPTAEQI
jgi:hypothetical protein